ncbi:MAG: hypothetical protein A2231_10925 [Candidatus Firestonebacteria bacterium RIFOXYA2_FULL_40_8]|nr:MAG: hypothetical protein A2231_10925 [Candidatus Firestonebacteria bacterium RIFOXYA2_FULL_40_8]
MLIDSHCHLQFRAFAPNLAEVISRCQEKQVGGIIVGTQIDTSRAAVELAATQETLYAVIGLHPIHLFAAPIDEAEFSFQSRGEDFVPEKYAALLSPKVVGIGECGLEMYHIPATIDRDEYLAKQIISFEAQAEFARVHDLALVIHVREAHEQMISVLKGLKRQIRGVVHCFTGSQEQAQEYLSLGLHLGFTGIITFPPKKNLSTGHGSLREVIRQCPLDRLLIETDAPYLAPQKYRGQQCEPWMVEEVAKQVAEWRNLSWSEVQEITVRNTQDLFKISTLGSG